MKKYLFIVPSFASGGAERAVANLSSELARQGEDVTVIIYFRMPDAYQVHPGVKVINLSGGEKADYDRLGYVKKIGMLRRLMKDLKPDYILPFLPQVTIHTTIAGFDMRKRIIHTIRNNPAVTPGNPVKRFLCNQIVCHSHKSIVQNRQQRDFFPEKYRKKIHVLFNPVSPELLDTKRAPDKKAFTIIGVGRLERQKNFPLLIRAAHEIIKTHPQIRLRIYGEGTLRESLQGLIDELGAGDRISLMGRSSQMQQAYASADLFVLSSDYEGMPNTLIEAMAVGLPCISTDCKTGPSDLITDGENGLLIPVGDENQLICALEKMVQNSQLADTYGIKARETIQEVCAVDAIVGRLKEICME